ncbi:MAG TPA: L-histidine N(alpha)-methyltransferase [Rubrobacteraceae bacterium]|nr:L-histidine N(alpha)-methyltransferase [Rubrobacteraceae bacterium]
MNRGTSRGTGNINITLLDEVGSGEDQISRDVRAGLLSSPKDLSPWPKYFYDAEGSRLFEEITELPEYYQTRAELSILQDRAKEIIEITGSRELVELGSGSASKTRALLDALLGSRDETVSETPRYMPLDVSESALRESGERLTVEYPQLEIQGYVGDFDTSLGRLLGPESANGSGGRLVIFLGGTIGNFTPEKRRSFLRKIRAGLTPGEHALIGVDLVKDRETLEAAYDDSARVTARFNKNMLSVLNNRLGAGFEPDLFEHRAIYNEQEQRIEMWLDSCVDQNVPIPALGLDVRFAAGEGMRTEISTKFTPDSASEMLEEAGLELLDLYTDERNLFGLALGRAG